MRNTATWMQGLAYALLALAIAAAALAFATLRVLDSGAIPGAASGYRYYTLGVMRSTGPSFAMGSIVIAQLDPLFLRTVAAGMATDQKASLRAVAAGATTVTARVDMVTGDYMRALHVSPLAGRLLQASDVADCAPVVVLSASLAQQLFGSPAQAVGRSLRMAADAGVNGPLLRVVGVVPDTFKGLDVQRPARAWAPVPQLPALSGVHFPMCTASKPHDGAIAFSIFGLPAVLSAPASVSLAQLDTLLANAWQRLPASARGKDQLGLVVSAPFSLSPQARLQAAHRTTLYLALAIAALVLATINVFTLRWLALVRRRHVLQLERVLGATRAYLRRRYVLRTGALALALLLASTVLSALGYWALHALVGHDSVLWASLSLPALAGELVWALPLLLLIVVLAEALPLLVLLQRERIDGGSRVALSRADRGIGIGVLVAEVLLAAVMSCAAAWALHYAWQQRHADLGMLRASVTIVSITRKPGDASGMVVLTKSSAKIPAQVLLFDVLQRATCAVVPDAHLAIGPLPVRATLSTSNSVTAGTRATSVMSVAANPAWRSAAGVRLLAGRNFTARRPDSQAVLIDAHTARALFGHVRTAIGGVIDQDGSTSHVIGVIAPLYLHGPSHDAAQVVIGDFRAGQSFFPLIGGTVFFRPALADARTAQLRAALDAALQRQAPTLQVTRIESSQQVLARLTRTQTRQAQVFLAIALFAWAIALSGVAAHLRLYLAMRRRLAAIRSALGAGPRRLYGEVLGGTLALAGAGIALSLLAAPWLAQQFAFLSGAQVAPFGAATWIALAVLLLAVFLVAHFPARRAARAEPAASLHEL
ncbi:ABC transporter permease [Metallibacterium scheffleri]|nr:ABC transporter permease [Metallibacterium scheffleri]